MKAFKVTGTFLMGRKMQPFSMEVASEDETSAKESTYTILGSKHRAKRRKIEIDSTVEVKVDDIKDVAIKYLVKGK